MVLTGTVRFTYVDNNNTPKVRKAHTYVTGKPQGTWALVPAYKHEKRIRVRSTVRVIKEKCEKAGFIVWKGG